jgi:hypothetical protein
MRWTAAFGVLLLSGCGPVHLSPSANIIKVLYLDGKHPGLLSEPPNNCELLLSPPVQLAGRKEEVMYLYSNSILNKAAEAGANTVAYHIVRSENTRMEGGETYPVYYRTLVEYYRCSNAPTGIKEMSQ